MNARTSPKNILRSARGQSLVELTLITPLLLLLVLGAVEVGSVISTYLTLTHMTREGANLTSRGTTPAAAIAAIKSTAAPTIENGNIGQWRIIYSKIVQDPDVPCPPLPCNYEVESQIVQGGFGQTSELGNVGQTITIPGIDNVNPNQTFHALEVFYDYTPQVMTFVGNYINKIFYDRTIFTNVSNIS